MNMANLRTREAFARLEQVFVESRRDKKKRADIAVAFRDLLLASGKTVKELHDAVSADKSSVDRWLVGRSVPHTGNIVELRRFFFGSTAPIGEHALAPLLMDPKYRPMLRFVLEYEAAGQKLTREQVDNLLWLAERSQGEMPPDAIRTFLGL